MMWVTIFFISSFICMIYILFSDSSCMSCGDHYHDHDGIWLKSELEKLERKNDEK